VNAAAALLALASAVTWGTADFAGGFVSRRVAAIPVTVISQAAGFAALLIALAATGGGIHGRSFGIGVLSGLGGGAGLAAFYKALSLGTMSIVSPIAACGAIVPFTISIATGERPGGIPVAGAVLALAGAVLASAEERKAEAPNRTRAVVLAAVAALALGLFTYFLGLGSREGSALSTLTGARVGSLSLLVLLAAGRRESLRIPRRWLLPIVALGLCDLAANVMFALASRHGLLSLVSVIVALAYVILHERLTRTQLAGVAAALVGVAAMSTG
jgi:drug/metabolite transporter (DMT)-like permease